MRNLIQHVADEYLYHQQGSLGRRHCKQLCRKLLSRCIACTLRSLKYTAADSGQGACAVLYVSQSCNECLIKDRGTASLDVVKLR